MEINPLFFLYLQELNKNTDIYILGPIESEIDNQWQ